MAFSDGFRKGSRNVVQRISQMPSFLLKVNSLESGLVVGEQMSAQRRAGTSSLTTHHRRTHSPPTFSTPRLNIVEGSHSRIYELYCMHIDNILIVFDSVVHRIWE